VFKLKSKSAFTLIELLVVIAIIGLLSTLSIVALNTSRSRARDARRVADMREIRTALEMYFTDMNQYPAQSITMKRDDPDYTGSYCLQASNAGFSPLPCNAANGTIFMSVVPFPPNPGDGVICNQANTYGWIGNKNYYYYVRDQYLFDSYRIEFCLGSQVQDLSAGIHTATPGGIK